MGPKNPDGPTQSDDYSSSVKSNRLTGSQFAWKHEPSSFLNGVHERTQFTRIAIFVLKRDMRKRITRKREAKTQNEPSPALKRGQEKDLGNTVINTKYHGLLSKVVAVLPRPLHSSAVEIEHWNPSSSVEPLSLKPCHSEYTAISNPGYRKSPAILNPGYRELEVELVSSLLAQVLTHLYRTIFG